MNDYYKESFDFVNSFYPLPESIFKQVYEFSELKQYGPNETIIDLGVIPQKVYLILNGAVRSYLILDDGREIIKSIYISKLFFTSFKALVNRTASLSIYETISECDILEIDYHALHKLCKSNIDVKTLYSKYLEFIIFEESDKYMEMVSLNAKERYLSLRKKIPDVDNLMPQYQIASYLGISPVQLSRIRSKLNRVTSKLN